MVADAAGAVDQHARLTAGGEAGREVKKGGFAATDAAGAPPVVDALRRHLDAGAAAGKELDYFTANRARMRHPAFRA